MRTMLLAIVMAGVLFFAAGWLSSACAAGTDKLQLIEDFSGIRERVWVGENLWANRLADWRVDDGYMRPVTGDPRRQLRTVHAITRQVIPGSSGYSLSVEINPGRGTPCRVGFLVGAGAGLLDYRAAALVHEGSGRGGGLLAFLELGEHARLTFRDNTSEHYSREYEIITESALDLESAPDGGGNFLLRLDVNKAEDYGAYNLALILMDAQSGRVVGSVTLPRQQEEKILGSFALAYSPVENTGTPLIGFRQFRCGGDGIASRPERAFGPIVGTLFSVAGSTLKLTAQFVPLSYQGELGVRTPEPLKAYLQTDHSGQWETADSARITTPDNTAVFRVGNWDSSLSTGYRVAFTSHDGKTDYYTGTVPIEPELGGTLSVAAFTGMGAMGRTADAGSAPADKGPVVGRWTPANIWFPFEPTVSNLLGAKIDLLSFNGDQVYEGKPTNPERSDRFPVLDYLYKWYLWHWAFGDLTRNIPALLQVDDHDVYQGNVWGWGGRINMSGVNGDGGYLCDPQFVRMVEHTQCSHNPDPPDQSPVLNDIDVYFTTFEYGGVSFALLEDRKFKTPRQVPVESAILLGNRQLAMLDQWATDWKGASMKMVLSQSVYGSIHTNGKGEIVSDYDSHGWPPPGRNRALEAFSRAGAMVLCGDQHLGTLTRQGVERGADGVLNFCVPAIGNIFWRWFYPALPGVGPLADSRGYTGDFKDGFGNSFRMIAAANPTDIKFMGDRNQTLRRWSSREQANVDSVRLCQGDGVGIVRLDTGSLTARVECWPYNVKPAPGKDEGQFEGWPRTFARSELSGRKPSHFLARVDFDPGTRLAAAIYSQDSGELIWSRPLAKPGELLGVFSGGSYRVRLFECENPDNFRDILALEAEIRPGNIEHISFPK
jgi:alkaline phosphatase D